MNRRIRERLIYLGKYCNEDYPDQKPMNIESLLDCIEFLSRFSSLKKPRVYLTFPGNIIIEWGEEKDELFTIEFIGGFETRYVLFSPTNDDPDKIDIRSGKSSMSTILTHAEHYKVLRHTMGWD